MNHTPHISTGVAGATTAGQTTGAFDITKIPTVMRHLDMPTGAALLDKWLSAPADRQSPDTTTISIAWVRQFQRANRVFADIFNRQLWKTPAALAQLAKCVWWSARPLSLLVGQKSRFGAFGGSVAPGLHKYHFQHAAIGDSANDPLDDLSAALGNFSFYIVASGVLGRPSTSLLTLEVEQLGVYIRDSFDFNDTTIFSQPLGCWDTRTNRVSKIAFPGGQCVTNKTFRDWRDRNGRGGDFDVFSDVYMFRFPQAPIVELPAPVK